MIRKAIGEPKSKSEPNNLIQLDAAEFLPRWRWADLESILAEAVPEPSRERLALCLSALKIDAPSMRASDILSDLRLAVRLSVNR